MPREYGASPLRCNRCDEYKPKHAGECHYCGEPGCDACMEMRESQPDQSTGYADSIMVCSDPKCIQKRLETDDAEISAINQEMTS